MTRNKNRIELDSRYFVDSRMKEVIIWKKSTCNWLTWNDVLKDLYDHVLPPLSLSFNCDITKESFVLET